MSITGSAKNAQAQGSEAVQPLLEAREKVRREIAALYRKLLDLARNDVDSRRSMTVPSIGPIIALAFRSAIDEPARFRRSRSVGAYVGLTPRRYASGEVDWSGRISKCGDRMLRTYLFEAADVLLTRVAQRCKLKAWGHRLWKRIGFKKAKVAVAWKLALRAAYAAPHPSCRWSSGISVPRLMNNIIAISDRG